MHRQDVSLLCPFIWKIVQESETHNLCAITDCTLPPGESSISSLKWPREIPGEARAGVAPTEYHCEA